MTSSFFLLRSNDERRVWVGRVKFTIIIFVRIVTGGVPTPCKWNWERGRPAWADAEVSDYFIGSGRSARMTRFRRAAEVSFIDWGHLLRKGFSFGCFFFWRSTTAAAKLWLSWKISVLVYLLFFLAVSDCVHRSMNQNFSFFFLKNS